MPSGETGLLSEKRILSVLREITVVCGAVSAGLSAKHATFQKKLFNHLKAFDLAFFYTILGRKLSYHKVEN